MSKKSLKMSHAKFWNKNTNVITIHQNFYTNKIRITKGQSNRQFQSMAIKSDLIALLGTLPSASEVTCSL